MSVPRIDAPSPPATLPAPSGDGQPTALSDAQHLARRPFEPVEEDLSLSPPPPTDATYLRRILFYGGVSALLAFIIYVFMEDPGGVLSGLTGYEPVLSWNGLVVYSSIIALALFLVLLLFRYFGLMLLAYVNTAKYTAQEEANRDFPMPPISIIVPAYNEGPLLRGTVQSLIKLRYPEFEVVIVDDGSKDETREVARSLVGHYGHVEVKLVEKPNGGKSTALNAGIQNATYDFVLCVDGDSKLHPDTLWRCIRHFEDPRVGAVAGNVKVDNRKNVWTRLQALEYVEGLNMARAAQSLGKLVNIIPGPLGLFRKEAIESVGWYNSDTFAEDCDITLKLIRAGWHVEYEQGAVSYTEAPQKLLQLLKQRYRWTRGIIQAIRKHKTLFWNPTINLGGTAVMWSMAFESLAWPVMNVFANFYFIFVAVFYDVSYFLVFWWLSLTVMDVIAALYCVAVEKEEASLIFYSVFYRLFFILIIDVCKVFATAEEFMGIGMTWGKLDRIGSS